MSSTGRLALHFRRLQNSGLHGLFLNCPPSQPFVKWKSCRNEPGRLSSSSGNLQLPKDVHSREAVRWSFTISFKGKKHVRNIQATTCAVLLCPAEISSGSGAVAPLSTQPALARQSLLWPGCCSQPHHTVLSVLSVLHTTLFSRSLILNLQLPYKEKASVWHSHENVICYVHICIYNNNGSSSNCSRKKIVARWGADHLAPDQNIWTISATGLCMLDIPGSNITINSVNSIYRMSVVLVIQCKWYQNTARS